MKEEAVLTALEAALDLAEEVAGWPADQARRAAYASRRAAPKLA